MIAVEGEDLDDVGETASEVTHLTDTDSSSDSETSSESESEEERRRRRKKRHKESSHKETTKLEPEDVWVKFEDTGKEKTKKTRDNSMPKIHRYSRKPRHN